MTNLKKETFETDKGDRRCKEKGERGGGGKREGDGGREAVRKSAPAFCVFSFCICFVLFWFVFVCGISSSPLSFFERRKSRGPHPPPQKKTLLGEAAYVTKGSPRLQQ